MKHFLRKIVIPKKLRLSLISGGVFVLVAVFLFSVASFLDSSSPTNFISSVFNNTIGFFSADTSSADVRLACPTSDWGPAPIFRHIISLPWDLNGDGQPNPFWACVALKIALAESELKWDAYNSAGPYRGLYQYHVNTWKAHLADSGLSVFVNKDLCASGVANDINPDHWIWWPFLQATVFHNIAYMRDQSCGQWNGNGQCRRAADDCAAVHGYRLHE